MMTGRKLIQSAVTGLLLAAFGWPARSGIPAMIAQVEKAITPEQALIRLREGNARFATGKMLKRDLLAQVKATRDHQSPFAVIVGCIDSRVSPEFVFDQGIGDIFSARVAGNFVNTDIIGSLEFATKLRGSKLIVVLGHTECGAIKGACDNAQLGNLTHTLSKIMPAVHAVTNVNGERSSKNKTFVQQVADANIRLNLEALSHRSLVLRTLVEQKQLKIVGAMYDLGTGRVKFF